MIYAEACQAQGMTLADLLAKQNEEKGWPAGVILPCSYLQGVIEGKNPLVQTQPNNPLQVYNDLDETFTWMIYYGSSPSTEQSVKSGAHWSLNYSEVWTVRTPDGSKILIQFLVEPGTWSKYGIDQVELPPDTPLCAALWSRICTRCREKYWKRYLAGETLEDWQVTLQTITDENIPRFERALRLYVANPIEKDLLASTVTDYGDGLTDETEQTKAATSKTTMRDTPDTSINDSSGYAGTVTDGTSDSGTLKSTKKGKITVTQTGGGGILEALNSNVDSWRDIETEIVKSYASAFMSYVWS